MPITTLPRTASAADALSLIERDGCVIMRDLAPPSLMAEVARELEPYFQRTPTGEGYFVGYRTKRMGALVTKSAACRELVLDSTVLEIMNALLGPYCSRYQLNLTQAIRICPGEPAQILHRDDELFPFEHPGYDCMVNALWAYDDFTEENGATRIVPGSHRRNLNRTPFEDEICHAVMPRGSVLLYVGSAVHSGGANRSAKPRTALTISYSLGWLRQAENQYLAVPPEVARTLPEPLQQLIGYAIHAPNLGWYEGQDPGVVLKRDERIDALAAKDYMPAEAEAQLKQHYAMLRPS